MNSTEIALFTFVVFLFIIAIFLFVLLRKSWKKKQPQEPNKLDFKEIIDITPAFKSETPGLNESVSHIRDLIASATSTTAAGEREGITGTVPEIVEPAVKADVLVAQAIQAAQGIVVDDSDLKLEDTLIEIEEDKVGRTAGRKKPNKEKKPVKKIERKKKPVKEVLMKEVPEEIKNAPVVELSVPQEPHEKKEKKKKATRKKVTLPDT